MLAKANLMGDIGIFDAISINCWIQPGRIVEKQ